MKKLIKPIGIYLGAFIVLNVAMFFVLKFTQPEHSGMTDETLADSTGALHGDSTLAQDIEFDHEPDIETAEPNQEDSTHSVDHASASDPAHDSGAQGNNAESDHDSSGTISDSSFAHSDETEESEEAHDPEVALTDTPKSTVEIAKLAKVLEGMKPAEAAVIAERLPTETIVELVMRMKSRNGAKMMASLPVPVAASVATRMAELSGVRKPS